ncbi:restriction endonuclease subunit S [Serratia fonticola]|uniref:Restriction endonuclease subunit S n=1 Tax=Serratia fonticola TaxID=47917 RepID=A0AAE7SU54_SERFO|nr:restriction endonuclease subunit S [Serratia fonticola]QXT42677.1 restriction endonuclease subunit S [Serratia fonticola]
MVFNEYSFKDLLIDIVDNRGRTCPIADIGIPLIATNCIKNTGLYPAYEKIRYVSDETYKNWFRGHPQPGDMIFVCKGSPGNICWVPDPVSFCIAQDMVAIRADITKIYPKYLFALLRSEMVQKQILNMHVGTLIPHFKKGDFTNLYLQVPADMDYQCKVGDVYFLFCEKIEYNHQINQTLEQIAQALFKSWFVDFEPVKAKIAALDAGGTLEDATLAAMTAISSKDATALVVFSHEQPEQYAELKATAELFPAAMQESELGEIPQGWEEELLGNVAAYLSRGISPKYLESGGLLVLNQKCIRDFRVDASKGRRHDPSQRKVDGREIQVGDVLINSTGVGTLGRVAQVHHLDEVTIVDSHVTVVRAGAKLTASYLGQYMGWKQPEIEAMGEGSTGQTELSKLKLAEKIILIPPKGILAKFDKLIYSINSKISANERDSQSLTQLRDTLLPKLLSGEITLPEAEAWAAQTEPQEA